MLLRKLPFELKPESGIFITANQPIGFGLTMYVLADKEDREQDVVYRQPKRRRR